MLSRLKSLLSPGAAVKSVDRHERIQVATCALLLEMAHADGDLHDLEQCLVADLVKNRFGLPDEDVADLLEFAQDRRQQALDIHQFARQINADFSVDEKLEVLEELWRIVYADGVMDKYEEYLMRQLTSLLRLSHLQMIETKLRARDALGGNRSQ